MGWSDIVDISKFEVSAAPYGGPIGENHGLFEWETKYQKLLQGTLNIHFLYNVYGIQIKVISARFVETGTFWQRSLPNLRPVPHKGKISVKIFDSMNLAEISLICIP